jgi:DNA polymerase
MWSERQRTLLQAMGLRVWAPPLAQGADAADAGPAPDAATAAQAAAATVGAAAAALPATPVPAEPAVAAARAPSPPPMAPPPVPRAAPAGPAALVLTRAPLPAAVATLGWGELRAAVAGCTACALASTRKQTVFGTGHPQAHWLVVGEAPGAEEDARGEPFVGAAGQLLDAMLSALDLTRAAAGAGAGEGGGEASGAIGSERSSEGSRDGEDVPLSRRVYIANTLKCRPPANRNPAPGELAACEPFLRRQIELLRPRIVLAMGRFAVQSLLGSSEPLGRLRGRVHRFEGVPLIVTYHPAYLLRSPLEKAKAWDDLCLAAEVAAGA